MGIDKFNEDAAKTKPLSGQTSKKVAASVMMMVTASGGAKIHDVTDD